MGRPKKCYSEAVGGRGHRVTLYERTPGGPLWLRWWVKKTPTVPAHWEYRALEHTDRETARTTAREIAAQLLASHLAVQQGRATIAEVLAVYEADVARHTRGQGPKEAKRRIAMWTVVLGPSRDASSIDTPTLDRFCRERRAGALVLPEPYMLRKHPSDRAVGADLEFLRAALNHATRTKRGDGRPLLSANPMAGYAIPENKIVRRPVATYDRFLKVRATCHEVDPQHLFGPFMDLVEGLGWRVSAICALRARDLERRPAPSAPFGQIYKAPERDKEGAGGWIPMSESVRAAVDSILAINPAIGDMWLFPAPKARVDASHGKMPKAWTRHHARQLLHRAEDLAGVGHLDRGDFHPLRRKWATERKHLPVQDVAKAGGWLDTETLQLAYQQTDPETILAVVTESKKLREVKPDSKAEAG